MTSENEAGGQDRPEETGGDGQKTTAPKLADIAADWGCSVPYVSKCKARGCPVDSLEAARAWRMEQSAGRGAGYRSRKREEEGSEGGEEPEQKQTAPRPAQSVRPVGKSLKSINASLKAAIQVEESAKRLVDQAIEAKKDEILSVRITAYNKARDGRYDAEKMVQEILEKNRVLVPLDEAKRMVGKVLGTLFSRLRAVPRRAAPKANPTDDLLAEEVIRKEIEEAIAEVHRDAAGLI